MLKIEPRGTLKEKNGLRIKTIQTKGIEGERKTEDVLERYEKVFQCTSVIKDPSTGQDVEVHLKTEQNIVLVAQRPRHIPYHVEESLKKWIN